MFNATGKYLKAFNKVIPVTMEKVEMTKWNRGDST
jgi:hypothetical protein